MPVVFSSQTPQDQLPVFNATEDVGLLPVLSPTTKSGTTTVSEWAWVAAPTPTPATTVSDIPEYWGLVTIAVSPDLETITLLQKNCKLVFGLKIENHSKNLLLKID